jgi:hypothetical protein
MWKPGNFKGFSKRESRLEHSIHKQRLSRVSSRIDNTPPKKMTHVSLNCKGRFLEQSKKNSIQSSNKLLVDRLIRVSSRKNSLSEPIKRPSSLNRSKKVEEISRITSENFKIFNKLKTCRPYYPVDKLEKDFRYSSRLKKRISQAPRVVKVLNKTHILFNPAKDAISSVKCLGSAHFDFVLN